MLARRTLILTLLLMTTGVAWSQWRRQSGRGRVVSDRSEYPTWELDREFKDDVFTFVRIQYDSNGH